METSRTFKEVLIDWIKAIDTRVETLNDRTKSHTIYIKDFEKRIKKLEQKK